MYKTSLTAPPHVISNSQFPSLDFARLITLSSLSIVAWLIILIFRNSISVWFGIALVCVLLFRSLILIRKNIVTSLAVIAYLAMIQPALRRYLLPLPYLTLEYFYILWVILALGKYKFKKLQAPAIFYGVYILLELSGVFIAVNPDNARSILVSSLALGFSLLLVKGLSLSRDDLATILMAIFIGAFSLVTVIVYGYVTSPVYWVGESSFSASGNMGPVQISMLLSVSIIMFLCIADRANYSRRIIYIILAGVLTFVMVLTFSRNGLYLIIISLITYYLLFSKLSAKTVFIILILSILGRYIFDLATEVAGPAFVDRFSDLNPTNRDLLVRYGWQIFLNNPILGVGTSNYATVVAQKEYFGSISGAHNELIRAAAEHGLMGLFSWVLFALTSVWAGFSRFQGKTRALRMTLLAVFFAYLAVNGIKLIAQPLLLLIALSVDEF